MSVKIVQEVELTQIITDQDSLQNSIISKLQARFPLLSSDNKNINLRRVYIGIDTKIGRTPIDGINYDLIIYLTKLEKTLGEKINHSYVYVCVDEIIYQELIKNNLTRKEISIITNFLYQIILTPKIRLPRIILIQSNPIKYIKSTYSNFPLILNTAEIINAIDWHNQVIKPLLPKSKEINIKQFPKYQSKSTKKSTSNDQLLHYLSLCILQIIRISKLFLKSLIITGTIPILILLVLGTTYFIRFNNIKTAITKSIKNNQFNLTADYALQLKQHCSLVYFPQITSIAHNQTLKSLLQLPNDCQILSDSLAQGALILNRYLPIPTNVNTLELSNNLKSLNNSWQVSQLKLSKPLVQQLIHRFTDYKINTQDLSSISKLLRTLVALLDSDFYYLNSPTPINIAIIFQNNNEIRPTGGFIGSLAIAKISDNHLIDYKVHDVYDLDGQLLGHVNPPEPLKSYLNQPAWYLRDSNWSPDFPSSVENIKWFIKKTVDIDIDSVIAVDTEVLAKLLDIFGPIKVQGINTPISRNNFQTELLSYIETDFYPGSRRKTNAVNQLVTDLKIKTFTATPSQLIQLNYSMFKLLDTKHILINTSSPKLNNFLTSENWNGRVGHVASAQSNINHLYYSPVEANLGVNKANKYLDRSYQLSLTFNASRTTSDFQINYTNHSTSDTKLDGPYKTYLQFPNYTLTNFSGRLLSDLEIFELNPEHHSINGLQMTGYYFEVPISSQLSFNLRQVHQTNKEYTISIRKQPGTNTDPISITLHDTLNRTINLHDEIQGYTLTSNTSLTYNTQLQSDLYLRLSFQK